ncbi:YigZ family protein [Proteinivorax tanatarense]|uniref:YigZ family protein n=1 Tax=Proteinivorax tanatarense TaxID=1260629 RepID=A0AAU7VIP2_9FIRM
MLDSYRAINKKEQAELEVKKSKFIAVAAPAKTEEEALSIVEEVNKRHHSATHNVYAYLIGQDERIQKSNDDGEPSGTAGKPILELIKKEKLKNVVVVVTRYFGGIKLGTGGLIRAYSQSAKAALIKSGIGHMQLLTKVSTAFDYSFHGKIENYLQPLKLINSIQFTDKVEMELLLKNHQIPEIRQDLLNITSGQLKFSEGEKLYSFKEEK